ncbi:hypothetical protein JR316_0002123 [Psilocybe cubensis]|uniref:Uncharacterized protein n=2 Tax=Psilocybe cubensis TaxID=181762 RepID=A0A8H7Y304_PSICU|nr:hypothetical protein JR316_0002123 [Psilocybe cubensis]KAH9485216.1 hypothetical protein JR316_0002123 [Psilocybe cubensis]
MALTDDSSSFERELPPPPISTSRQASIQSLHSLSDAPDHSTDYRSSFTRDRSSRESRRSFHNEIELRFQQMHSRLQAEKRRAEVAERRAEDAERKLREITGHLKAINDARLETLRDAGRAHEELKQVLYRVQLDNAQQEIYRAQDIIGVVDRQRYNAEKDAEKQRRKARQLQETVLIQKAREEAFQQGLQEGLARGRELTFGEFQYHGGEEVREHPHRERVDDNYSPQGSRSSSPERNPPNHAYPSMARSIAPSDHSRAPTRIRASPLPANSPLPINPPVQPLPHPAGPSIAPPSIHPSEKSRPPSVRNVGLPVHPPETVRPVSIRKAPSINESIRPTSVWNAPSLHGSENIHPIPIRNISHTPRLSNAIIPPDNLIPSMDADNRIRIPPPFEFQSDFQKTPEPSVSELPVMPEASLEPVPIPPRVAQQRKHNSHSRNSSSGSNSSSLSQLDIVNFNPALRTPMSVIPEVNSVYSGSPQPRSEATAQSVRHQPSLGGNSFKHFPATVNTPGPENQSQFRPRSRSSFAPSMAEHPTQSRRESRISTSSTVPNIDIQAPSNTASIKTDSQWGEGSGRGATPSSQHASLPNIIESEEQGSNASAYSYGEMPGSYVNINSSAMMDPPIIPKNIDFDEEYKDDDAVSSALSADTLTTPPGYHKKL